MRSFIRVVLLAGQEIIRKATFPMMKKIPRFLPVTFLLLAIVSAQDALAGDCSSGKCPFASVAPAAPPAPAAASTSRAFTAVGGTRVADVNLSPEGRERLAAGDKEEPLPKGFSTAADRTKSGVEHSPLYGWSGNEIRRPSSRAQSHDSIVPHVSQNSLLKPREAKPFTRRSVAKPATPATAIKVAIAANAKT